MKMKGAVLVRLFRVLVGLFQDSHNKSMRQAFSDHHRDEETEAERSEVSLQSSRQEWQNPDSRLGLFSLLSESVTSRFTVSVRRK